MTAIANISAGSRILASEMAGIAPLSAVKTVDESVTSSTTLQNDDALFVTVAANATYLLYCYLDYEGASAGDLKFSWSVPTSATMRFTIIGQTAASAAQTAVTGSESTSYTVGADAAATLNAVLMTGTLVTSSSSGTLQLQWAQGASTGTATKVHAQSFLALWQVS